MIRLYQFSPLFGLPNASPFCMKLETYLRMAGHPYEVAPKANLMRAPKGKFPYIKDGDRRIGDSGLIIDYLKQRYGDPLDGWLTPAERAVALAFQRLFEEHLYWALLHTRWMEEAGWRVTRGAFFRDLPPVARRIVPLLARRGLRREIWGHGLGRHSRDEIYALGNADIGAVAEFLADKPYLMGEQPCSLDATAYAFLANILWVPLDNPLRDHARRYPNLEGYCRRMKARYFAEG